MGGFLGQFLRRLKFLACFEFLWHLLSPSFSCFPLKSYARRLPLNRRQPLALKASNYAHTFFCKVLVFVSFLAFLSFFAIRFLLIELLLEIERKEASIGTGVSPLVSKR